MKRDMDLIRELLQILEATETDRGFSFEQEEATQLNRSLDEIRYNLHQAEQMGLIEVGSKPLQGEWTIRRLTPKGHEFLEQQRAQLAKTSDTSRSFPRQLVIAAADILKTLGHSGFDRFLLELGISDKVAGRGNGLLARANSLCSFAFQNPDLCTPEGTPITEAIVARAVEIFRDTGALSLTETERTTFMTLAMREGLDIENGSGAMVDDFLSPKRSLLDTAQPLASAVSTPPTTAVSSRKVFLVHGHDENAKNEVALFLRKIGLEDIILHQRPSRGRHLLTKFQEEAEGASFAVILMTPDDEGGVVGGERHKRARQNVVLELGFFIGKFGTPRVAALIVPGVEKPSDFDGICWIEFGPGKNWKIELARELREAGLPFDAHEVFNA